MKNTKIISSLFGLHVRLWELVLLNFFVTILTKYGPNSIRPNTSRTHINRVAFLGSILIVWSLLNCISFKLDQNCHKWFVFLVCVHIGFIHSEWALSTHQTWIIRFSCLTFTLTQVVLVMNEREGARYEMQA